MTAPASTPWQSAWAAAYDIYSHLAHGGQLDAVPLKYPGLLPEAGEQAISVLDSREGMSMGYSRFTAAQITYAVPGVMAMGSPHFVAGALLGNAVARRRARRQAEREAAPQWRPDPLASVVITTRRLWCEIATTTGSRWLNFDHNTITRLTLTHWDLTLRFLQVEPLRLSGMWAPWCAALVAHFRYGPSVLIPAFGAPRPPT